MTHFNTNVSPQHFHLPICLSSVYFLSLSPCFSVVCGVWEMRHFANGTSQINLKFRFFFFFCNMTLWSTRGWQQSLYLLANSDSMSSGILSVPGIEDFGAAFPSLSYMFVIILRQLSYRVRVTAVLMHFLRGMEEHCWKYGHPKALALLSWCPRASLYFC